MRFKSEKQRQAVMASLRKYGKVDTQKNYINVRLKNPKLYSKFRTIDTGKPGSHMLTRGYRKGKWETQKVMIEKKKLSPASIAYVDRVSKYKLGIQYI